MRTHVRVWTSIIALVMVCTKFAVAQQPHTGEAQVRALLHRYYSCWNTGSVSELDAILSNDYVRHEDAQSFEGIEPLKQNILAVRAAYSGLEVSMTDLVIGEGRVVHTWNLTGTHTGQLGDIAPTGRPVDVSGVIISRISNGQIAEEWSYFNQLRLFAQLGYKLTSPEPSLAGGSPPTGDVVINGSILSEDQIAELEKTYSVKPLPGDYWYDSKSGLYGVVGYQAFGFMYSGHDFGQLDRNASNGNTMVIVNGRELPQQEWRIWSQVLGYPIQQGSYWFDQNGNAGYEGSPVTLVNLYVAAQQNAYRGAGGGDNFWTTRFSAGNYDSGNQRGYVSVPGYGPVGYGF
ncbi:ester cyclase [bacterium]|nr:ester cyclase [bacterium]